MANQILGGPYVSTSWVNGVTAVNATRQNNLETQAGIALHAFNPDLIGSGFILSGCAASGTVGTTTVNIASGRAYTVMTDGTVGCIVVNSTTQTTSALSSTYNLYLQPDGTFYWSTSNAPQANSLYLATVATNGSGQISSITDKRSFNATMLSAFSGTLTVPPLSSSGNIAALTMSTTGTANFHALWAGSGAQFEVNASGTVTFVGNQATAGGFGVPVVVAQGLNTAVTTTTDTVIATFTPGANGLYRVNLVATSNGNTNLPKIWAYAKFHDPSTGSTATRPFIGQSSSDTAVTANGTNTFNNNSNNFASFTCYADTSAALEVHYQNSATGTINDHVSAFIERLS